jgi:hypothetical protein
MTLRRKVNILRLFMLTIPLLIWLCLYWEVFEYPLRDVIGIAAISPFFLCCAKCDKPVLWNRLCRNWGPWGWTIDLP